MLLCETCSSYVRANSPKAHYYKAYPDDIKRPLIPLSQLHSASADNVSPIATQWHEGLPSAIERLTNVLNSHVQLDTRDRAALAYLLNRGQEPATLPELHQVNEYPLDDEEVREITLWQTDAEIPAFRAGWMYRRHQLPPVPQYPSPEHPSCSPEAKMLGLYPENQNARVAWERGWMACHAVYTKFFKE